MSEAVLDVKKQVNNKPKIKRLELDYKDMNYIIINFEEKVIDVNGELWEYTIDEKQTKKINDIIWEYENIDEYDYWPDNDLINKKRKRETKEKDIKRIKVVEILLFLCYYQNRSVVLNE